jgi:hypothetical protein
MTVIEMQNEAVVAYSKILFQHCLTYKTVALGGLVVSVLAIGLNICGFRPGRRRWVF